MNKLAEFLDSRQAWRVAIGYVIAGFLVLVGYITKDIYTLIVGMGGMALSIQFTQLRELNELTKMLRFTIQRNWERKL